MTLRQILYFLCTISILFGLYQIYWVILTKRSYPLFKLENETLFDYCQRQYQGIWKYFKRKTIGWFINSKIYLKIRIIFGIVFIILGICGFIITHFLVVSNLYGIYMDLKI